MNKERKVYNPCSQDWPGVTRIQSSTLVPAGSSLQCMQCISRTGDICTGIPVSCAPVSDVCISSLVQDEINTSDPDSLPLLQENGPRNVTSHIFIRDCGTSSDCEKNVFLRNPYNRIVTSHRCCQSNLCSPDLPKPILESPPNGLTCPGCLSFTEPMCKGFKAVQCRGSEKQCFSFSSLPGTDNDVTLGMQGCASQTACNIELETGNPILCMSSGSQNVYLSLLTTTIPLWIKLLY
ncbi:phospholipase A2 inhibitor NAI-like [Pelodytes ibericus]